MKYDLIYKDHVDTRDEKEVDVNYDDDKVMIQNPENEDVWFQYELIDADEIVIGDEMVTIITLGRKLETQYFG